MSAAENLSDQFPVKPKKAKVDCPDCGRKVGTNKIGLINQHGDYMDKATGTIKQCPGTYKSSR